jgi:hypothetical protein
MQEPKNYNVLLNIRHHIWQTTPDSKSPLGSLKPSGAFFYPKFWTHPSRRRRLSPRSAVGGRRSYPPPVCRRRSAVVPPPRSAVGRRRSSLRSVVGGRRSSLPSAVVPTLSTGGWSTAACPSGHPPPRLRRPARRGPIRRPGRVNTPPPTPPRRRPAPGHACQR